MQLSKETKDLLLQAWPNLYLSEVAMLLNCGYGTAYRALQEAGCFPPASAGRPEKTFAEALQIHPELVELMDKNNITPRRYLHAYGYTMANFTTIFEDMDIALGVDFPELSSQVPPSKPHMLEVDLDYRFFRSGSIHYCQSSKCKAIYGAGKSKKSALYHADMAFMDISAKGRLMLFLQGGMEAALQWQPSDEPIEVKPQKARPLQASIQEDVEPEEEVERAEVRIYDAHPIFHPKTALDLDTEIRHLRRNLDNIPNDSLEAQRRRIGIQQKIDELSWQVLEMRNPEKAKLMIEAKKLSERVSALQRQMKIAADEGRYDDFDKIEDQIVAMRPAEEELAGKIRSCGH